MIHRPTPKLSKPVSLVFPVVSFLTDKFPFFPKFLSMITLSLLVFAGQASAQGPSVSLRHVPDAGGTEGTVSGQGTTFTVRISQTGVNDIPGIANVAGLNIDLAFDTSVVSLTTPPGLLLSSIAGGATLTLLALPGQPLTVPASVDLTFTTSADYDGSEFTIEITGVSSTGIAIPLSEKLTFNSVRPPLPLNPQLHLDTQIESPAQNNSVLIFTDKRPGDTLQIQLFVPNAAGQDIQAFTLELALQGKTFADFISSISGSDLDGGYLLPGTSESDLPILTGLFLPAATVPMTGYLGQIDLKVIGVLSDADKLRVTSAFLAVAGEALQSVDVSNAELSFAPICPGDFDDNGMVNMADFLLFGDVFGTRSSDAAYNALMDMDSSGGIDVADFLLFVDVFDTTCKTKPPPPPPGTDYDTDNDGLIEISSLAQLDAIRYDLDGDGVLDAGQSTDNYDTTFPNASVGMGCPSSGCIGYELTANLDFDTNGDGDIDVDDAYWNDGAGWLSIGGSENPFSAIFDGNNHTIANLYINQDRSLFGPADTGSNILRTGLVSGLFGLADTGSDIKKTGLVSVNVTGDGQVGTLVGRNLGVVTASYATGNVAGNLDDSVFSSYGGLVGFNNGTIIESYTGIRMIGNGNVGGLVGFNYSDGRIFSSYASDNVTAYNTYSLTQPTTRSGRVGGLVGSSRGTITDSYATGDVTHTYAVDTPDPSGRVGGLIGTVDSGSITASYATGKVTGHLVGGLIGSINDGGETGSISITASYWDTQTSDQSTSNGGEGKTTRELQSPTSNTGIYTTWDNNVWDFGTSSQYPALKNLGLSPAVQWRSHPTLTVHIPDANLRAAITDALGKARGETITAAEMATLQHLDASQQGVSDLTGLEFATNLRRLYLSGNNLTELPESVFSRLGKLELLNLDVNRSLRVLPPGVFARLHNLRSLTFSYTQLETLPADAFSGLESLVNLSLYSNRSLTSLPAGVFDGLKNLQHLNLDSNRLASLPVGLFSDLANLRSLWLRGNELTSLPVGLLGGLVNLQELFLKSNLLTELPAGVFSDLKSLKSLTLGNNQLSELSDGLFIGLNNLKLLDLTWNPGAPFPLNVELKRTDTPSALAPGPAEFEVALAPGTPFDIDISLMVHNGTASSASLTIEAGSVRATASVTAVVGASGATVINLGPMPRVPGGFTGINLRAGAPLVLFSESDNRQPAASATIPPHVLQVGGQHPVLGLGDYYSDEDGDELSYSVWSNDTGIVQTRVDDGSMSMIPTGAGEVSVDITATDPEGFSVSQRMFVTVLPAPDPRSFDIDLVFGSPVSKETRLAAQNWVERWTRVIRGDLPDVPISGDFVACGSWVEGYQFFGTVDDLVVFFEVGAIRGGQGLARTCGLRDGSLLPYTAHVFMDAETVAGADGGGPTIGHELGHALGFGTVWDRLGFLQGSGGDDPHFNGPLAIQAFDAAGGANYTRGKVPVSRDLGHWKGDVFGWGYPRELMMDGGGTVLSAITGSVAGRYRLHRRCHESGSVPATK